MRSPSLVRTSIAFCLLCSASLAGCEKPDSTNPPGDSDAAATGGEGSDDAGDLDSELGADADAGGAGTREATTSSVLTMGSFEDTVNENMEEILDCYVAANEANPKLVGTMKASFSFDGDGKVTAVTAEEGSTLSDEGLTTCITEKAQGWSFPAPASGAAMTLAFPLDLAPG